MIASGGMVQKENRREDMISQKVRKRITWESPLLLAKVVARRVPLTLPVHYPQLGAGKRELISAVCLLGYLYPDQPDHAGFTVSEKGYYHCFGCSAHGDVIRVLTDVFELSVAGAVKYCLASPDLEQPLPTPLTSRVVHTLFNPLLGTSL